VTKRTCNIILEVESGAGRHDIGIVVDTVNAVLDIPASEIEPAPSFGAHIRTEFICGMAKVNGRFVILLDVDRVLAGEEMRTLVEASETAPAAAGG
jgi:purine-binding chemotaxis protein CheW